MPDSIGLLIEFHEGRVKEANFAMAAAVGHHGRELTALVVDASAEEARQALEPYGITRILDIRTSGDAGRWSPPVKAAAAAETLERFGIDTLVGLSSTEGRQILPRIAAQLDAPLVMDCVHIDPDARRAKTSQYSGKTMATIALTGRICIYGLRPNAVEAQEHHSNAEIVEVEVDPKAASAYQLVETRSNGAGGQDLAEAQIIIAGGRGLQNGDNFTLLKDCAELLGAAVGASRVAVDNGWVPYSMQVGQTGVKVNPKVYLAVGISGSVQHFAGMKTASTIIAINTDEKAPIIANCDYYAVGDLFTIIPELKKALSARL